MTTPAPTRAGVEAMIAQFRAERIVWDALSPEEQFRRNGEYVPAWLVDKAEQLLRALLDAADARAVPPREPTEAMIEAGVYAYDIHLSGTDAIYPGAAAIVWRAMYDAAPSAQQEPELLPDLDQAERDWAKDNPPPAAPAIAPPAEPPNVKHVGECATDELARAVCDAIYAERTDEVLGLVEALDAIDTLCGGHDEQSKEIRHIIAAAIKEHAAWTKR